MKQQFLTALRVTLFLTLVCGIFYPLSVFAIGNVAFAHQAQGSLVRAHGKIVGSSLLGQTFTGDEWFHTRPSNAGVGYDATASAASNLGPTNSDLVNTVKERVKQYRKENNLANDVKVPVDAVTSSGSGLDPEISVANAYIQSGRVAHARKISITTLNSLIKNNTHNPYFAFLGEKTVNVVTLNRDLTDHTRK